MFEIRLFGTPEILYNGSPVRLTRKANRALLLYLAANGVAVSRDSLLELFWERKSLERARAGLRETLSRLRTSLPEASLLVSQPESVSLDFNQAQVDYLQFMALSQKIGGDPWRIPPETPLPAGLYTEMVDLIHLYRMPGFLPTGVMEVTEALAHWRDEQAIISRGILLHSLDRLYAHAVHHESPDAALQLLRQSAQVDRLNETRQRRLIEGFLKLDMRQEARAHFSMLEKIYLREQASDLPDELDELRGLLYSETRRPRKKVAAWEVRPTLHSPFVGRQQALQQLQKGFASAGSVIIYGEAGAGKTRLVQEFYRQQAGRPRLLLAHCRPFESNLPFQPWLEMLRRSLTSVEWLLLDKHWAATLAVVLPEIRQNRKDLTGTTVRGEHARPAIFEAIHRMLVIMARDQPLFIFMDDAHWADESSLELAAYLIGCNMFSANENFFVLAARLEADSPALNTMLLEMRPQQLVQIRLNQLSQAEVGELAQLALHAPVPDEFVERVSRDSGGNPFFVLEILQPLLESHGKVSPDLLSGVPLTGGIQQLMHARLQMLPPHSRDVLQAAAIRGSHFEASVLERALSMNPATVAGALTTLENARFIARSVETDGEYDFMQEKIRELLLANLPPATNRLLHRKMAEALEQEHASWVEVQAALIASFYEKAGLFEKAFHFWTLAAGHAYRLHSIREAQDACEHAAQLIPRAGRIQDDEFHALYRIWNKIGFELDDVRSLMRINQGVMRVGRERGSDLLIGTALTGMGNVAFAENKFQQGISYIEQAFPYLERANNKPEMLRALQDRGLMEYMSGNFLASQEWFRRGLSLVIQTNNLAELEMRGGLNYQMAITYAFMGHPHRAMEYAVLSMQDHMNINSSFGAASSYAVMSLIHFLVGRFKEGAQAGRAGLDLIKHMQTSRMLGYLQIYTAANVLELGELGNAWQHARKAIETGQGGHHSEIIAAGNKLIGDIYFCLHDMPAAVQHYQQAFAIAGDSFVAINALSQLGSTLTYLGRPGGSGMIEQAREICQQTQLLAFKVFADLAYLRDHLHRQDFESFDSHASSLAGMLRVLYNVPDSLIVARLRAELVYRKGAYRAALEAIAPLVTSFQQSSAIWPSLRSLSLQLQCQRRLGQDASETERSIHIWLEVLRNSLGEAKELEASLEYFSQDLLGEGRIRT